jgi:hypothetical protein
MFEPPGMTEFRRDRGLGSAIRPRGAADGYGHLVARAERLSREPIPAHSVDQPA